MLTVMMVVGVVVMVVAVRWLWWWLWRSGDGCGDDSLCKSGSFNSCRIALVKVVVLMVL